MAEVTPLVPIQVASIYPTRAPGPLPGRMAMCTPDTKHALEGVVADLRSLGHELRLSDLFRSYAMQKEAHDDYVEKRKTAYSPPPGGSMHEAGRAMDIDLSSMGVSLSKFWEIARAHGFFPIIDTPDPSRSESWHFDCRGSHDVVYQYVRSGKAGLSMPPYTQMAQSAILATGEKRTDRVPDAGVAGLQAMLIRLGFDPGRIDGVIGDRTNRALRDANVAQVPDRELTLSLKLKQRYPDEF